MAGVARPRGGIGCLGTLVGLLVVVAIVVAAIFVGVIALGVFAALVVIGVLVVVVDRIALALSPKRRERRANQQRMFIWRSGQFGSGDVIDSAVIDTTASSDEPRSHENGHDDESLE
jgi:hypothetical protein